MSGPSQGDMTRPTAMSPDRVLVLWCRLTGTDPVDLDVDEQEAFLARPQVPALAATPYPALLEAGVTAARRGSLPLERWLNAVQASHPVGV